jgi:hypothetical protein
MMVAGFGVLFHGESKPKIFNAKGAEEKQRKYAKKPKVSDTGAGGYVGLG